MIKSGIDQAARAMMAGWSTLANRVLIGMAEWLQPAARARPAATPPRRK